MMDIAAEMRELALMTYSVSIKCRVTDGEIKYLVQAYTPPNKSGTEVRIGVVCDTSLDNAFYTMIQSLHEAG